MFSKSILHSCLLHDAERDLFAIAKFLVNLEMARFGKFRFRGDFVFDVAAETDSVWSIPVYFLCILSIPNFIAGMLQHTQHTEQRKKKTLLVSK